MRGQRKFARPPARSLAFRTGCTDKFFGLSVERLQLGIINRPVRSDTETGFHFHRVGMDAMRLTGKMQRRAANTADVIVLLHPARAACNHRTHASAPRHQQRLGASQFLSGSKTDGDRTA